MSRPTALTLVLLAFAAAAPAAEPALGRFGRLADAEFSPARGERIAIPIVLTRPAGVRLRILSPDGDLVRTLGPRRLDAGRHVIEWDGRDDEGTVVPDEAYVPVLELEDGSGARTVVDPRAGTGGEIVPDEALAVEVFRDGLIRYRLPAPARVLVRVGLKQGPMLRALADWTPRLAGSNVHRWDGWDRDRLLRVIDDPRVAVLVTAFRLPEPVIVATGNRRLAYPDYRRLRGWPDPVPPARIAFERDGRRLSPFASLPRMLQRDPRVLLEILERPAPGGRGRLKVRVDIPPEDRWWLEQGLYEVAFFIDGRFEAEEEHGYVPITWVRDVAGLAPGRHVVTVNVAGFRGQVGVRSAAFEVPPDASRPRGAAAPRRPP